MARGSRRKCKCCRKFFCPDPCNRRHQRYCSEPACRAASKAASQARWLARPENHDYFRGPAHLAPSLAGAYHPCYWCKDSTPGTADIDIPTAQVAGSVGKTGISARSPLQDLFAAQPAVVIGLIAHHARRPLQDDIKAASERPRRSRVGRHTSWHYQICDGQARLRGPAFGVQLHLLFAPRREHLPFRPRKIASARAQSPSRLAAFCALPVMACACLAQPRRQDRLVRKNAFAWHRTNFLPQTPFMAPVALLE